MDLAIEESLVFKLNKNGLDPAFAIGLKVSSSFRNISNY